MFRRSRSQPKTNKQPAFSKAQLVAAVTAMDKSVVLAVVKSENDNVMCIRRTGPADFEAVWYDRVLCASGLRFQRTALDVFARHAYAFDAKVSADQLTLSFRHVPNITCRGTLHVRPKDGRVGTLSVTRGGGPDLSCSFLYIDLRGFTQRDVYAVDRTGESVMVYHT